jgi:FtsZ-binding cell division protein ZapB
MELQKKIQNKIDTIDSKLLKIHELAEEASDISDEIFGACLATSHIASIMCTSDECRAFIKQRIQR